jgi:hypothetical protein
MTGCVKSDSPELLRRLDAAAESLVPHVRRLLGALSPGQPVTTSLEDGARVISVPVRFPDGIGAGRINARVFRYRNSVRVDLTVLHNRMIALADGRPTGRACFLNDFVASVTLGPDDIELPEKFLTQVETGVSAALDAVDTHNRRYPQPWSRIRVVAI